MDRHFSGESIDFRQVIAIIIPVFIDQVFLIGLNLINTAMVSSSGMAAVSAVNMVDSLNQFALNIFIALATGGTVVVAKYYGIKNNDMVSRASSGAILSLIHIYGWHNGFPIILLDRQRSLPG